MPMVSESLQVVTPDTRFSPRPERRTRFTCSAIRDIKGLNFLPTAIGKEAIASPAQLEALIGALKPGEEIIAHLDFATPSSSGLSIAIVAGGETRQEAMRRRRTLGKLLDAALAASLPIVDLTPRQTRSAPRRLAHKARLAPAGIALPLHQLPARPAPARGGDQAAHAWRNQTQDAIVFSPRAFGPHLVGFGAIMDAIETPVVIEVRMARAPFDAALLKQIAEVHQHIKDRQHADVIQSIRDQRYADADRRLEALRFTACGISLEVTVHSRRELETCEISQLSATLFGTPHDPDQSGHLAGERTIYPSEDAVQSFLGIVTAAVPPAIERRQTAKLDALQGSLIGRLKSGAAIRMPVTNPRSHTYVVGRSGSGKSTLLLNLIVQDIENGEAVVVIDPHGDLVADIRARMPAHRLPDLVHADMGDPALQPRINILELGPGDPAEARALVVETLYQLVRRMMYSGLSTEATGPMFNKYFRAGLMLLLEAEGAEASLDKFETIFGDASYRNGLRRRDGVSEQTRMQWSQIIDVDGEHSLANMTPWITSKLTQLTQSTILRPVLAPGPSTINFDDVLASRKVCLVTLANGLVGAEAAGLIGGILTQRIEQAAKRQQAVALDQRHTASVYLDEFHTFASEFLRPLMSETRKFGLRVTLANQTLSQMVNNDIAGGVIREVLGSCANTIVFAVDAQDAAYLAPRFEGRIDPNLLASQSNHQAVCRFQNKSEALGPFVVRTLPPPALTRADNES